MFDVDVLLVLPPVYQAGRIPDYNPKEPMGLMYLAAVLRQNGFRTELLDADLLALSLDKTKESILRSRPRILGFSVLQRALPSLSVLAHAVRPQLPETHIVCGGIAATLSARHLLERIPAIDSVILGEGEDTLLELVSALVSGRDWKATTHGVAFRQGDKVSVVAASRKPDVKALPRCARDLLPICLERTGYATVLASRGCASRCTFCSNAGFEDIAGRPHWRARTPADIAEEVADLRSTWGVTAVKFNDPCLFGPGEDGRRHVAALCQAMMDRGLNTMHFMAFCRPRDMNTETAALLRRAGFERMLIGIESSDDATLRRLNKGETLASIERSIKTLRNAGLDIVPGFLVFHPYTTLASIRKDVGFLRRHGFTPIVSKALRVFDGIGLERVLEREGRLIRRSPIEGYHEYTVPRDVAAIYMALKHVFVEWCDPVRKEHQNRLWRIKKAPSFNARESFYELGRVFFDIESDLLEALVSWAENKTAPSIADVTNQLRTVRKRLQAFESKILEMDRESRQELVSGSYAASRLAKHVREMLTKKAYETFPEQYRWNGDD